MLKKQSKEADFSELSCRKDSAYQPPYNSTAHFTSKYLLWVNNTMADLKKIRRKINISILLQSLRVENGHEYDYIQTINKRTSSWQPASFENLDSTEYFLCPMVLAETLQNNKLEIIIHHSLTH